MQLGPLGIWCRELRELPPSQASKLAQDLERAGYSSFFVPGRNKKDIFSAISVILDATSTVRVGTGILSIWLHPASEVAVEYQRQEVTHPGRFIVGLGVTNQLAVEALSPADWHNPLSKMAAYCDELDHENPSLPRSARVVAALGPRMTELGRDRAAGTHTFLSTIEHTKRSRKILGPDALLITEQALVLTTDKQRARALGRQHLGRYVPRIEGYTNHLRRLGFEDTDFIDGGSDRLVDEVVAWGTLSSVVEHIDQQYAAGSSHVLVHVLQDDDEDPPLSDWLELAETRGLAVS